MATAVIVTKGADPTVDRCAIFSSIEPRPSISTLFPYTTLFRSDPFAHFDRVALLLLTERGQQALYVAHRQVTEPRIRQGMEDRKSTRLNSSHMSISYAVFCLKKKMHAPRDGHGRDRHQGRRSDGRSLRHLLLHRAPPLHIYALSLHDALPI